MTPRFLVVHGLLTLALLSAACSRTPAEPPAQSTAPASRSVTAPAGTPHWSYEGEAGPDRWGTLSPEWAICSAGARQSPIDIDKTVRTDMPALSAGFTPAGLKIIRHEHTADVLNSGHSIQVNYTEGDTLAVGADQFDLQQYHFHSPSEHTIGGKRFAMEMHLVHKSRAGKLAVVGVLIEEGAHNAAFDPIWSNLPESKGKEFHLEHVTVDIDRLLPARKTTYRYEGSLTTPPCTEGVAWFVLSTPVQLSAAQLGAFRAIVSGNNRPVQPLNGRVVATDHLEAGVAR